MKSPAPQLHEMKYAIVGWEKFQHYKDRNPPWIKLHRVILTSYRFARLPDASKAHFYGLLLLASEDSGTFPGDPDFLAEALHATEPVSLAPLVTAGLIRCVASHKQDDSDTLSFARSRETETETETDTLVSQAANEPPAEHELSDRGGDCSEGGPGPDSGPKRAALRALIGPAVRRLNRKRDEQSRWMQWARCQVEAGRTEEEVEAWVCGLVLLRDTGKLGGLARPGENVTAKVYERQPDVRSQAESAFWAAQDKGKRTGLTRLRT